MTDIQKIDTVQQYNDMLGVETLHPLVSVVDFSEAKPVLPRRACYGLYCVFLKNVKCGDLRYGNSTYDYHEGTIVTTAPGQVYGFENVKPVKPSGMALVFHPDFICGTELGRTIRDYHFFSYESNEALHLSTRERELVEECFRNIKEEIERTIDKHTQRVICREINLLLDYCLRFYDRQFITRHTANSELLSRFEMELDSYLNGKEIADKGIPSVAYFADKLCLSPNYFGDLVKKETGSTAKEYIQSKVIGAAKQRLLASNESVSEIAYALGFQYANHFTRMFKNNVGMTPIEFRKGN